MESEFTSHWGANCATDVNECVGTPCNADKYKIHVASLGDDDACVDGIHRHTCLDDDQCNPDPIRMPCEHGDCRWEHNPCSHGICQDLGC